MSAPTLLPGFTRRDLVQAFKSRGFQTGAEIGVRQAAFSLALCEGIPGLTLLCVDPWVHYPANPRMYSQDRHDTNYLVAQHRLQPYKATLVRATSMEAVPDVALCSLDFVYIDGNHGYPYVKEDLAAWSDRVRSGGIVSGDDYDAPGVRRALEEFVTQAGITAWWITDDPGRQNRRGDRFTSWFWVKP